MAKPKVNLFFLIFTLALSACTSATALPTIVPTVEPTIQPTVEMEPHTPTPIPEVNLPKTDAEVPRVSVDVAKAALDTGQATIVDVRSKQSYDIRHIAGAIHFSLGDVLSNPTSIGLDKNQWIITYCT